MCRYNSSTTRRASVVHGCCWAAARAGVESKARERIAARYMTQPPDIPIRFAPHNPCRLVYGPVTSVLAMSHALQTTVPGCVQEAKFDSRLVTFLRPVVAFLTARPSNLQGIRRVPVWPARAFPYDHTWRGNLVVIRGAPLGE